jgi:DNA-directed RNA polymerase sigma subunit (sigma70/sigma32)
MTTINSDTLRQLEAFNSWLLDVYGEETSFNSLLVGTGFSKVEIEQIKQKYLKEFLQAVMKLLVDNSNPIEVRGNRLIGLYYGLNDGNPQTIYTIGTSVGVSPTRIRQLLNKALALYRDPERLSKFQDDFALIGQQLLDNDKGTEENI